MFAFIGAAYRKIKGIFNPKPREIIVAKRAERLDEIQSKHPHSLVNYFDRERLYTISSEDFLQITQKYKMVEKMNKKDCELKDISNSNFRKSIKELIKYDSFKANIDKISNSQHIDDDYVEKVISTNMDGIDVHIRSLDLIKEKDFIVAKQIFLLIFEQDLRGAINNGDLHSKIMLWTKDSKESSFWTLWIKKYPTKLRKELEIIEWQHKEYLLSCNDYQTQNKLRELYREVALAKGERDSKITEARQLTNERNGLQRKVSGLEADIEKKDGIINGLNLEIKDFKDENIVSAFEHEKLKTENKELSKSNLSLTRSLENMNDMLNEHAETIKSLEKKNADLESNMNQRIQEQIQLYMQQKKPRNSNIKNNNYEGAPARNSFDTRPRVGSRGVSIEKGSEPREKKKHKNAQPCLKKQQQHNW